MWSVIYSILSTPAFWQAHSHTPKYLECTAVWLDLCTFRLFWSIIWWSQEAAQAPTTKQKVINLCGKTMEHLCSQVCHPYFCSRGCMATYVFIWSVGLCVCTCVCERVTEPGWQRDSHVASWHFSSAMTHRDITPYQSHKHAHSYTRTQSFLNPPLLFSLSVFLSFLSFFLSLIQLLPSPSHSLAPSRRLLFTNFLSFSLPLSFFLSCSVASWQSARECWYQLVDWALPTWRRAKMRKEADREKERGRQREIYSAVTNRAASEKHCHKPCEWKGFNLIANMVLRGKREEKNRKTGMLEQRIAEKLEQWSGRPAHNMAREQQIQKILWKVNTNIHADG